MGAGLAGKKGGEKNEWEQPSEHAIQQSSLYGFEFPSLSRNDRAVVLLPCSDFSLAARRRLLLV